MKKQKLTGIGLILLGASTLLFSNDATAFVFLTVFFGIPLLVAKKNYMQ